MLVRGPWHQGRVVLLGDAVHATTPHLGQGAGMAIEDSVVLAEEIARAADPETAFTAFRNRRFERCRYIVEKSLAICNGQIGKGPPVARSSMIRRISRRRAAAMAFAFFRPTACNLKSAQAWRAAPAGSFRSGRACPKKISHIVLHSPNHQALVTWFCDVLGFKVSDWLGDFMCFLRCNSAHHRFAILPGPPCLNHVAYDMLTLDDMMRGAHRLKLKGIDIGWGPGRHTAGNNTFSYFVTPAGFVAEYTSELEEVDFETREATVHVPAPQVMDQWGIGTGGPQTLPHPHPNPGLFVAIEA